MFIVSGRQTAQCYTGKTFQLILYAQAAVKTVANSEEIENNIFVF